VAFWALAEIVRQRLGIAEEDPPEAAAGKLAAASPRRDRKTRHLAVAAHLHAAFPGDGAEVSDVIARHYLDALDAVPDAPDAAEIRGQAIAALTRAADRAIRTGAPARAAASYATAARLTQVGAPDRQSAAAAVLWEYAAWAWPLAARATHDLADTDSTRGLLALLDGYQPGQLASMQRAERELARARLAAAGADPDAGPAFAAAIAGLR
jgi:hypothetical protein